tara:strand:+ start:6521 stop:7240 length:720 start_codon:yes stop_codon:yes gene_type:complete
MWFLEQIFLDFYLKMPYIIEDAKESVMNTAKKIESALSLAVCGGWDRKFLESVLSQIEKGRDLSVRQRQTLGKVLARNTPEADTQHTSWAVIYEKEHKASAKILAMYHIHQPYYRPMSKDILKGIVPGRNKYLRMADNKYSKKVLHEAERVPRFNTNAYVVPRVMIDAHKNIEFQTDMIWTHQNKIIRNFKKRGGFVVAVLPDIRSAAKGAKRYKLLPIGETTPIIVEERFLKAAKKKK